MQMDIITIYQCIYAQYSFIRFRITLMLNIFKNNLETINVKHNYLKFLMAGLDIGACPVAPGKKNL